MRPGARGPPGRRDLRESNSTRNPNQSPATGAWIGLVTAIIVLLAIDLLIVRGRGGAMSARQAAVASAAWVAVSLALFGVLLVFGGADDANVFLGRLSGREEPQPRQRLRFQLVRHRGSANATVC